MILSLVNKVKADPSGIEGIQAIYQFDITDEDEVFQIKLADGQLEFIEEKKYEAESTFQATKQDFIKLLQGEMNPTMAVMSGKVKIKGNLAQAMKLQNVIKNY